MSAKSSILSTTAFNVGPTYASYSISGYPTTSLDGPGAALTNLSSGGVLLTGVFTGGVPSSLSNCCFVTLNPAVPMNITIDLGAIVKGTVRWAKLATHGILLLNAWENEWTWGVRHLIADEPSHERALTRKAYKVDLDKPWQFEAMKKLENLAALPKGWDSYGGEPLRADVRDLAARLIGWIEMDDLPVPAVVLGSAGTVQFEWKHKGRELEVEVLSGDSLGFLKVSEDGDMEEGRVVRDLPDASRGLIRWLLHGEAAEDEPVGGIEFFMAGR